ncbi:MAG: AI-2E family transporter [Candidatus Methanofastidiosia archaeon]
MFDKKLLTTFVVFAGMLLILYTLRPLIPAFCLALVLIYVTTPMTNFLQKYCKKRFIATLISFFVILLFFAVLSFLLIEEMIKEVSRLPNYLQSQEILADLNFFQAISPPEIVQNLLTENGFRLLVTIGTQVGNVVIQVFLGLVISFYVVWKSITLPVTGHLKEFLVIMDRGIKSVVTSLLITAIATGLMSIPIFFIFGLPYPLFLALLTGFLTLLPVIGAWLLYLPITGYLFFEEGIVTSVAFLVVCAVFISTVPDILVRPITGKTKEVGAIPLLIGFIAGLMVFGVSGIVLGPVIIIGGIAFWKVYIEDKNLGISSTPREPET